jgi:hypothetical protein
VWLTAEGLSVLSSSKGRRGRGGEEVERTLCELCIMQIFRWTVVIQNGDLLAPRRQACPERSRRERQVTAKVRHPERRRGIWERFLSEFTLSLVEGVEMTTLCAFARDIPSFGCGSAGLGCSW